jgi:hypothetical protein
MTADVDWKKEGVQEERNCFADQNFQGLYVLAQAVRYGMKQRSPVE